MIRHIAIIISVLAVACCPCRKVSTTTTVSEALYQRDSIYIEHYDTLRVVERDTVRMAPINKSHDRVSVMATSSYLENDYCTSHANVDELGILTHTLDTRDSALLPVRLVEVSSAKSDMLSHNSEHTDTEALSVVEVREISRLTWWQRTQIIGFWVVLGVLAIKYRKVILKVITGWRI